MADFERDRALMIRLWRMWGSRAADLSDQQWTTDTRLPGWTVRDLYVHITPSVMIDMLATPTADGAAKVTSAAEMLQVFNADPTVAELRHGQMAEMVRQLAVDADRATMATRFVSEFPAAFEWLTGLNRATVIPHPFLDSVALGAFIDVAILETTIHWLDVADAVGGPPPESMALERTRDILAAVPDPLTFVEAASGRSDPAILPVMR
ncbi:maleylpyruvate isomerase N-terminal domain-containing protein [Rhodococcus sp. As11]|uniref:maleylpyruvate isomerase N-terminal domain-containing protein n=1 Tax=Rhodococcus sp. As11 TaxID=3029189 RepID=UPI003B7B892C